MIMMIIILSSLLLANTYKLLTVYVGFDKKLVKIDINKNNTGMWYKCQPDRF